MSNHLINLNPGTPHWTSDVVLSEISGKCVEINDINYQIVSGSNGYYLSGSKPALSDFEYVNIAIAGTHLSSSQTCFGGPETQYYNGVVRLKNNKVSYDTISAEFNADATYKDVISSPGFKNSYSYQDSEITSGWFSKKEEMDKIPSTSWNNPMTSSFLSIKNVDNNTNYRVGFDEPEIIPSSSFNNDTFISNINKVNIDKIIIDENNNNKTIKFKTSSSIFNFPYFDEHETVSSIYIYPNYEFEKSVYKTNETFVMSIENEYGNIKCTIKTDELINDENYSGYPDSLKLYFDKRCRRPIIIDNERTSENEYKIYDVNDNGKLTIDSSIIDKNGYITKYVYKYFPEYEYLTTENYKQETLYDWYNVNTYIDYGNIILDNPGKYNLTIKNYNITGKRYYNLSSDDLSKLNFENNFVDDKFNVNTNRYEHIGISSTYALCLSDDNILPSSSYTSLSSLFCLDNDSTECSYKMFSFNFKIPKQGWDNFNKYMYKENPHFMENILENSESYLIDSYTTPIDELSGKAFETKHLSGVFSFLYSILDGNAYNKTDGMIDVSGYLASRVEIPFYCNILDKNTETNNDNLLFKLSSPNNSISYSREIPSNGCCFDMNFNGISTTTEINNNTLNIFIPKLTVRVNVPPISSTDFNVVFRVMDEKQSINYNENTSDQLSGIVLGLNDKELFTENITTETTKILSLDSFDETMPLTFICDPNSPKYTNIIALQYGQGCQSNLSINCAGTIYYRYAVIPTDGMDTNIDWGHNRLKGVYGRWHGYDVYRSGSAGGCIMLPRYEDGYLANAVQFLNTTYHLSRNYETVTYIGGSSSYYTPVFLSFNIYNGGFKLSGNVQSLVNWSMTAPDYCFYKLFTGNNCSSSLSGNAILPAEYVLDNCYESMFEGCTHIQSAILPAETLEPNSYKNMFKGCTNLKYLAANFTKPDDISENFSKYIPGWLADVPAGRNVGMSIRIRITITISR